MALNVTVSKPRMVLDIPAYFPNVIQLKNGELFVQLMWGNDRQPNQDEYDLFYAMNEPTTAQDWMDYNDRCMEQYGPSYVHVLSGHWAHSTDGGKTFTETGLPPVIDYVQKENGDVVALQWYTYHEADGQAVVRSWTSHDSCKSWDAPYNIPVTSPNFRLLGVHRRIIHLEGDTYLALLYGMLDGDKQCRSMVYRTTDAFQTLHYYATIGTGHPWMESPESGLTETDITRTPDGRLLAVMRNQSLCTMYQAHSTNDGATWTPVTPFVDAGVDPALCVLDNGVVVCSYGRPGVKIALSENNGDNWQKRVTLLHGRVEVDGTTGENASGAWNYQRSCCYTDVVQTAPNVATVFYSAPADWNDPTAQSPWNIPQRQIFRMYAVDVTVERT